MFTCIMHRTTPNSSYGAESNLAPKVDFHVDHSYAADKTDCESNDIGECDFPPIPCYSTFWDLHGPHTYSASISVKCFVAATNTD